MSLASSQPDLLSRIQVDSTVLQRFLVSEKTARVTPFAEVVKGSSELCVEAGEVLHKGEAHAQVQQIQDDLLALLNLGAEVDSFVEAMDQIAAQYSADLQATDFQNQISQHLTQSMARKRYDATSDPRFKSFQANIGADQQPDDSDNDDVVLENGQHIDLNSTCPITGSSIYDLKDPVQDEKGVVYERQAIMAYVHQRGGRTSCPVAGMSHEITPLSFRKCKRIIREQKRREAEGQQAGGDEGNDDDDGVDVE